MLFEAERHGPIDTEPLDDEGLLQKAAGLLGSVVDATRDDGRWPTHPLDAFGDTVIHGHSSAYFGAAGCLWTLATFGERLGVSSDDVPERAHDLVRAFPVEGDADEPGWFLGGSGVRAVALGLAWDDGVAADLEAQIRGNRENPTWEPLWGSPGTLLAARMAGRHAPDATTLRDAWTDSADRLWDAREPDGLWTQDLYGRVRQLLGAGHGFVGNLQALLAGDDWLDEERRTAISESAAAVLSRFAQHDGACANWPPQTDDASKMLVQWCHGAPGVISSLWRAAPEPTLDALLVAAGEMVWTAGALTKGAGLCHGTAGNGYALLQLFARTGDPIWLERARAFATMALHQADAMQANHGLPRCSLYTGDPGVVAFAVAVVDRDPAFPLLDV